MTILDCCNSCMCKFWKCNLCVSRVWTRICFEKNGLEYGLKSVFTGYSKLVGLQTQLAFSGLCWSTNGLLKNCDKNVKNDWILCNAFVEVLCSNFVSLVITSTLNFVKNFLIIMYGRDGLEECIVESTGTRKWWFRILSFFFFCMCVLFVR